MRPLPITEAINDRNLLGASLDDRASWGAWLAVLKAAFAEPMTDTELETFQTLAGGREPPSERVQELWAVVGRRGGKSRMAALLGLYLAAIADHGKRLAKGETGHVVIVSPTKGQSRMVRGYIDGALEASPLLAELVESSTADTIRLHGNIEIACHAGSFRSIRGRTVLAAILDEVAFLRDADSAMPDKELVRAILPSLATTNGMLIGISSPYRRVGVLAERHRDHYGQGGDVLVIQAPTTAMNPTINTRVIDSAMKDDPEAARAEWLAEFRSDLSSYLDDAAIDAAVDHSRPMALPPREGVTYTAFADASAGRHDHFTLCIGHVEEGTFIADLIEGRGPPFNPKSVALEFAALAKEYRCGTVTGDNYAGEWVKGAFEAGGVTYKQSDLPRSGLYLEALPHFAREAVRLPDHARLQRELRLLERKTHRSGKDSIDHPRNGHDDYANAMAGALYHATKKPPKRPAAVFGTYGRVGDSNWKPQQPASGKTPPPRERELPVQFINRTPSQPNKKGWFQRELERREGELAKHIKPIN